MNIKCLVLLICMSTSLSVYAGTFPDENKYKICFIKGFFAAEDDRFLMNLASHIANRKGLSSNSAPLCRAAHTFAYDLRIEMSTTTRGFDAMEVRVSQYALDFREKVNEAISTLIEK